MEWTLLLTVTFLAATVQSAIGLGFVLIAVSAFLLVLNSAAAIQLVMIIILVMFCVHWPKLRGIAPGHLLKWLSISCVLGFPLGILIYNQLDLDAIEKVIAVLIILISVQNGWYLFSKTKKDIHQDQQPQRRGAVIEAGISSDLMASRMSMP